MDYVNELQADMDYFGIPERMRGGIIRYLYEGVEPGGFLMAVFENNLRGAVAKADAENTKLLGNYAMFCGNVMPMASTGSPHNVTNWIKRGGLNGENTW